MGIISFVVDPSFPECAIRNFNTITFFIGCYVFEVSYFPVVSRRGSCQHRCEPTVCKPQKLPRKIIGYAVVESGRIPSFSTIRFSV
jgi:hypothetical protein